MGYAKRLLEEATEGGLDLLAAEGRHVCADCFTGEPLRRLIRDNACETSCSFCNATASSPIAAPLHGVVEYLNDCLLNHYDDPANWLPYETAEGGYQGETFDTWEVLENAGFHEELVDDGGELLDVIREALGDRTWCENDPYALREHQRLSLSWDRFCTFIKHERRFFFMTAAASGEPDDGDRLLAPAKMLETIVERAIVLGLITTMPADTLLYRVRPQPPGKTFRKPSNSGHLLSLSRTRPIE